MDIKLLSKILAFSDTQMFQWLIQELDLLGYDTQVDKDGHHYIIGTPRGVELTQQIALVAHVDTIPRLQGVELVMNLDIIRNKKGVLGADDRAGVYAILDLIMRAERKPVVIFTNYEETGGIGVKRLCQDGALGDLVDKINLFVELDRAGSREYVYYSDYLPREIHVIAQRYGFREAQGSYSDVMDLTDATRIPHLNLSIGYERQHSKHELLDVAVLEETIMTVTAMLDQEVEVPRVLIDVPICLEDDRLLLFSRRYLDDEFEVDEVVIDDILSGEIEPPLGDYEQHMLIAKLRELTEERNQAYRLMLGKKGRHHA